MTTKSDAYDFLQPPSQPSDLGTLGNYRILGELGKGGMGYVFRAEDTVLERAVALKVMNKRIASTPNSRDRFIQEARAMAAVHHDNVVVIFEVGTHDGTPFMAMEMLRGETLEALNARKGARDFRKIIDYAIQISRGLAAAHAKGIVHRDIKPANIWIEEGSNRIKILDFGLALAQSPLDEFTGVGSVCGTPGYLTPEQARSDPLDDRSDLYSLGVVLFEMCTGRLPIQRTAIAEQLVGLLTSEPLGVRDLNPEIPQPLADLIGQLLQKEPVDRPESATVLEQQLKKVAIECEAKTETAMSLNKLQESLKEVVNKQTTEVPEPIDIMQEMPAFDPLAAPATIPGTAAANLATPSEIPGAIQRIQPVGTPTRKPATAPTAAAAPVSPVVWLAAGVGITLAIVAVGVWMILPPKQESFVIKPPSPSVATPTTPSSPKAQQKPAASSPKPSQSTVKQGTQANKKPWQKNKGSQGKNKSQGKSDQRQPNQNATKQAQSQVEQPQNQPGQTQDQPEQMQSNNTGSMPSGNVMTGPDAASKGTNSNTADPVDMSPLTDVAVPNNDTDAKMKSAESMQIPDTPDPPNKRTPTRTVTVSSNFGLGADSTVRRKSANASLGLKLNLVVQKNQNEDLQHAYIRFDLQGTDTERQTIEDAILRLQLVTAARNEDMQLTLYGADIPNAENWQEDGPRAIKWSNSSANGLDMLKKLADWSTESVSPKASPNAVSFQSDELLNFVRQTGGKTLTFVVSGGRGDNLAVLFSSREKSEEAAPKLLLAVPKD